MYFDVAAILISHNGGGMKRWGFRSCEPINRYEPCQRVMHLANHLNPNVL